MSCTPTEAPKIKAHGVIYENLYSDIDFECVYCGCVFSRKLKDTNFNVTFEQRDEYNGNIQTLWKERTLHCSSFCPECKNDVYSRYLINNNTIKHIS